MTTETNSRPVVDDYELSPLGNPVAPDHLDPDRAAVYSAESAWEAVSFDLFDDPAALRVVAADDWLRRTFTNAGLPMEPPEVAFDLPADGHDYGGTYSRADERIHLPASASGDMEAIVLLHEAAHSLTPFTGHDAEFRRWHLALVEGAFGLDAAEALAECYADEGLPLFRVWSRFWWRIPRADRYDMR